MRVECRRRFMVMNRALIRVRDRVRFTARAFRLKDVEGQKHTL